MSMRDKCNLRSRSRKRIGKRKKEALKQLEGLVSARSPLGILTYWFSKLCRSFRKHIRRTGRFPARQLSCIGPILQDPKVSAMDSPLSRPQDYPEGCKCPPGTEGDEYNAASFYSGPSKSSFSNLFGMHRNQGGLFLQSCPTSAVSSHHSTERKRLEVVIGCSSSPQSPRFQTRLESSSNRGSHESRDRDNHKRKVEENMSNPNLAPDAKIRIDRGLRNHSQASQSQQSHTEILTLKRECQSLSDSNAALLEYVRELQEELFKEERRAAEQFASQTRLEEAARDELTRHLKNCRKSDCIASLEEHIQQQHDDIVSLNEEVKSLKSTVAELQASHDLESPEKPKSAYPEGYAQQNAISGSYADESATPLLLNNALSSAKGALKQFQKALTDAIKSRGDIASTVDLLQPDIHFARDNHVSYAARAVIYEVLFEGFENESFNTRSGVSRFLDTDVRQAEFFKYFKYFIREQEQNNTGDIGDPHFESFCERKVPLLWEEFNLRQESNKQSMQVACLEELGGPKVLLSFRAAAKKVWLLHKLAFSFEPPASIFRVEQGAAVDTNYMEPVVNLEDSSRFVNEVGFMISPGLRQRKTILRCEVYLASAKSATV